MRILPALFCSTFGCLFVASGIVQASVRINEIMYHPASGDPRESYVELYNSGGTPVNLTGWRFGKGLDFAFPSSTAIAPLGYLVVAADRAAFSRKYPQVTNVLSGWTAPMSSHLVLLDGNGTTINEVNYSNDGDWATRVLVRGRTNSFGHAGWEWDAPHDGLGSSLELMNPNLPNNYALNWGPSTKANGTPGQPNSLLTANVAPIITDVAHAPVLPKHTDSVSVTARLVDENLSAVTVTLFYRHAETGTPSAFLSVPMLDDGVHNDALASDGTYGAVLPLEPEGTVIEFYLQARDTEGHVRVYPSVAPPVDSSRTANLLYQVAEERDQGKQPIYRIIMTEMEREELYEIGKGCPSMDSDAQMNATWITTDGVTSGGANTQVRYNAGVRNRGHGTRSNNPNNYHLKIPADRPWKNKTGINLNSHYTQSQVLGSALFRHAGLPMPESQAVQLRVNSTNLMLFPYEDGRAFDTHSFGSYAANELYNEDFLTRAFALDPSGNSYRGIRDQTLCDPARNSVADLSWHGPDYATGAYTNAYFKQNNFLQNDWSDLLDLIAVLNNQNGYEEAEYASNVLRRINVDEWMKYMAMNTLLDNSETSLANSAGDDYGLYRGAQDTRFVVLPYDLDSVMGRGVSGVPPHHSLFSMTNLAVMDRFMKTPEFAPIYYKWLKRLADTLFAPAQMNPLLDQLFFGFLPQEAIDNFKAFNSSQTAWVQSQIPLSLTVSNELTVQSGYPYSTRSTVSLFGNAPAIDTRTVLINGSPAIWTAWRAAWSAPAVPLNPGVNRVLVQALDASGAEIARTFADIWYDDGTDQAVGSTLSSDAVWTAAAGPYRLTSSLRIASGATLTIEPGVTVFMPAGADLTVDDGGRLIAEGTAAAPIRFAPVPGSEAEWGGIVLHGTVGSPETRLAYAHFEGNGTTCIEVNGGTLSLDHATFGTTTHQYLALDRSSFLVSHCTFPASTAAFELVHGTGGIKAGGRGIVRDSLFGGTKGYNDVVDFTGGNREENQPIIQFYNNVFLGASDDSLDLDGTDAWIEHNIFLHVHKNGAPDSSSAVSGGNNGGATSQITIIGNLFFDCDQAATAKQGNFFTLINNTIVHMSRTGGLDSADGVVNVQDRDPAPPTTFGAGFYLEGNIISDVNQLVRNYDAAQTEVTFVNNILPIAWNGPGAGNRVLDPLLKRIPQPSETSFTNWTDAQVMWEWFGLEAASPARGAGPNGVDQGGVIPMGASVSSEPAGTNNQTSASLIVGPMRTGFGIPASSWTNGAGYTHYKWRLDRGSWSAETPISSPITLTGLSTGPHQVEVVGKRDSGWFQDAAELGPDARVTTSRTWFVDTNYVPPSIPTVRLNEILASNLGTLTNAGGAPDLVELYNPGPGPVDLTGMGISDNANSPYEFMFDSTVPPLGPGEHLVLYADKATGSGIHLGFSLKASGDDLYLHDRLDHGGVLLDSLAFGLQLPDRSIGRAADGTWRLCSPTFGRENQVLPLADGHELKINEWLADKLFLGSSDFVELYNPSDLPAEIGGCFLSNAEGAPALSPIPPLSFIAPTGAVAFVADGDRTKGADHVDFKLDANGGIILFSAPDLSPIDSVIYGPQTTDLAQGRSPSGSVLITDLLYPTPGGRNPIRSGGTTSVTNVLMNVVKLLEISTLWKYDNSGGTNLGIAWIDPSFNDSSWPSGEGLFGHETSTTAYPYPFKTFIPSPRDADGKITVYYRTHFHWDGSLTNVTLISTNYIDDGAVYYLNGIRAGALRLPATVLYHTLAQDQGNEGAPEILSFTNAPVLGDNVMAVEVHQATATSSDNVFGMELNAVEYVTNVVSNTEAVPVVLNEVLARDLPLTNTDGNASSWIELYNPTTNGVDLTGLSLSADANIPRQYVFAPGTVLGPKAFLWMECSNLRPASTSNTGFALKAAGSAVFLFNRPSNNGGLIDFISFGLQIPGFSIGRVPDGFGAWTLNAPSPAALNNAVQLGSATNLTINEWMAAPSSGNDWIEIYNAGQMPVSLSGFYFTDDLAKPASSPVPPLSFIGAAPSNFGFFQADNTPEAGADHLRFKLDKSGDSIGLFSPERQLVTAIRFGSQTTGLSQGHLPDGSTNVATLAIPTPGRSNALPMPDSNRDGLPDSWQVEHFGYIDLSEAAPSADPDHDGFDNLHEYLAGTDPNNAESLLHIDAIETAPGQFVLRFKAVAGKSYSVLSSATLEGGWSRLESVPARPDSRTIVITDTAGTGEGVRFYKLVTPSQ